MSLRRKHTLPIIACGSAYALWGLNVPFVKIALESVPVFWLLAPKYLLGAAIFLLLAKPKWRKVPSKYRGRIFIATIFGYTITNALIYEGIKLSGGVNASLVYLLAPLLLYFLSIEVLREKFNGKILSGLLIALLGSILIVGAPLLGDQTTTQSLIGNLLVIGAIIADITGTILIKPTLKSVPAIQMTGIRFMIAAITLMPFLFVGAPAPTSIQLTTPLIIALLYNFVFATLIAFYLYHWGLARISAEATSPLHYMDPLVGAVASIIILGEQISTVLIFGVVLVLTGLYISEVRTAISLKHLSHHR